MSQSRILFTIIFLALGCSSTRVLPPIPQADEIRVRGLTQEIARVDDSELVARVISIANRYPDSWSVPWYGPTVAKTNLVFYANGEPVADLGLGDTFLSRTHGNFYSRNIGRSELETLRALLDVANPYAE